MLLMSNMAREASRGHSAPRQTVETMKIVVLAKHVPDATVERSFAADLTVDRSAGDGQRHARDGEDGSHA